MAIMKKRDRSSIPIITFETLPKDMMAEILNKLSKEEFLRTLCLSNSLRKKIFTCLPLMKPLSLNLNYHGLLLQFKTSGLYIACDSSTDANNFPIITHNAQWDKITSGMFLDSCNGLLLFCNEGSNVDTLVKDSFYYFVINPLTKQCIAVLKPNPKSPRPMHAALAYDPFESSYFKIVRFQGLYQLNIFHSEKGEWQTVKHKLPKEITRASWETKSVYNEGALFRVSHSGYLIKFLLVGNGNSQAMAIDLPTTFSPESKCSLGVRDRKIFFVSISGTSLLIWKLKDEAKYKGGDNNWSLLNVLKIDHFCSIDCDGQILGIHPYCEVVFLVKQPYIYCADYSVNEVYYQTLSIPSDGLDDKTLSTLSDGLVTAFPLLINVIPFTCNSNKKDKVIPFSISL